MNAKLSIVGLAAMGLIAAFSAALLTTAMKGGDSTDEAVKTVTVLVAAANLEARAAIDSESFVETQVPAADAPEEYLSNPVQVVGKVLVLPVIEGQPLTTALFADDGPGAQLASALADGMRAVSVALENDSGMHGLLYPGSYVDVITSYDVTGDDGQRHAVSKTILQSVQVMAVADKTLFNAKDESDEEANGSSRRDGRSQSRKENVTLMGDASQAKRLQLAMQHGRISLAMRNPLDQVTTDDDSMSPYQPRIAAQDTEDTPQAAISEPATTAATPKRPNMWNTRVMRGGKSEVTQFNLDTNEVKVDEKEDATDETEETQRDLGQAVRGESNFEEE